MAATVRALCGEYYLLRSDWLILIGWLGTGKPLFSSGKKLCLPWIIPFLCDIICINSLVYNLNVDLDCGTKLHFECQSTEFIIIIIINSLTARVFGAPQMILQPVFHIFPCSPLPSGTCQGLSIPWCCLSTSSSICLVFFPLSLCLVRWFWPDLMNGRQCPYRWDF